MSFPQKAPSPPPRPSSSARDSIVLRQRFAVPFEYPVVFTWDVFAPDNRALVDVLTAREPGRRHDVQFVVDAGVAAAFAELDAAIKVYVDAHGDRLRAVGAPLVIPGGEAAKNDPTLVERLCQAFHARHIDRHAFVIIVGGGGVLDAAGYAAAITHRGLRTVRLPTTVLAQDDSGVGVKNGINAYGAKNFLGTFVPPSAVINDARFLERLPPREAVAGLAEAVKVALIRDAAFFRWIEENAAALAALALDPLATLVRRCAELHMRHIAEGGDPFEQGSARPLDFGHWAAHKLEGLTAHELRHGEAVAIGLRLDSTYAHLAGYLPAHDLARIDGLLDALGLPGWHPALDAVAPDGRRAVLAGLEDFREHLGGELTLTMLEGVGRAFEINEVDEPRMLSAIEHLRLRRRNPG